VPKPTSSHQANQPTKAAPRNRTLRLTPPEAERLQARCWPITQPVKLPEVVGRTLCQPLEEAAPHLPEQCIDLLFLDPPYNQRKRFGTTDFSEQPDDAYEAYLESWLAVLRPLLKPTATVYLCSDWRSSAACQRVLNRYFLVRNRITWEREKGRGATTNWKNASEDIWFATVGNTYTFQVERVKLKRRVIAPYRQNGQPKDWQQEGPDRFRLTHPSNLWTDLTVPFWSMPENTDHPTQKPEKLLAKLLLASTQKGDLVLDPFAGSGTTGAVATKLGRRFIQIEQEPAYAQLAEKRAQLALQDDRIQGYTEGVFWARNAQR